MFCMITIIILLLLFITIGAAILFLFLCSALLPSIYSSTSLSLPRKGTMVIILGHVKSMIVVVFCGVVGWMDLIRNLLGAK